MACRCLRVDQLDSHVLDSEIRSIAQDSVDDVVNQMPVWVSRIFEKLRPELKITLEAVLWTHRFSRGVSPGQEQMDISYSGYTPKVITGHFLVEVFIPYLSRRVTELSGRLEIMRMYAKVEAIFELGSLLHFLYFLRSGGHSTLTESILSLRNWNNNQPTISSINYDTQNRELLWHAFRDVILLTYPFIEKIRQRVVKKQKLNRKFRSTMEGFDIECIVCDKPSVIPMIGQKCEHVACYTCIATSRKMICPLCLEEKEEQQMEFLAKKLKESSSILIDQ
ncbi:CRE-PRX-2 protein [Caenorhabditis remanei]|uniref:RING-type E3 ubiquitin transferase (cysteine targeting) n=1 Tax=Caenorhabditis remanei TaxID=31234 RepID=E3M7X3_CAERE|nr:CRE-PRX-2 protein [Caenorhabditis remanei]